MTFLVIYLAPGKIAVVLADGKQVAIDFSKPSSAYVLEAIIAAVYEDGVRDGKAAVAQWAQERAATT
jgi:dsRNA-specific ribonuclease